MSSSNMLYGMLLYNQIKVDDAHAKVIFTNRMIELADGILRYKYLFIKDLRCKNETTNFSASN
ncbi:hypothetical protein EZS27_016402 [termite gut metagenome]|uniref:Uncharacterized protein n=1 Tax=termite gut metagenome TaxID=433724 RepID=A0A5J4RP14_9ZZZZ